MRETDRAPLGPADCHPTRGVVLWEHDADSLILCNHCSIRHAPRLEQEHWHRAYVDLEALNP